MEAIDCRMGGPQLNSPLGAGSPLLRALYWLRCQPWNSGLGAPSSRRRWPSFSLPSAALAPSARQGTGEAILSSMAVRPSMCGA
eukprot:7152644-Pyramimonas_sp.AAC.1